MLTLDRPQAISSPSSSRPRAVVIGSGFGGLAAAIRLGARGYRVTVVEKLGGPGGRAGVLHQDGFTFDLGPTIVTAPFLFEELWALCGRGWRTTSNSARRRLSIDPIPERRRLQLAGDEAAMRAEVGAFQPGDVEGYERFMRAAKRSTGSVSSGSATLPSARSLDMARIARGSRPARRLSQRLRLVSKYIRDERLRMVFSFHPLLIGGNPFRATRDLLPDPLPRAALGRSFRHGRHGRARRGLVKLIEVQGGDVRCGQEVESLSLRAAARPASGSLPGRRIAADLVVSNADSAWTYGHLVPAAARKRWTDRRIDRARYSMGLFVWYFGTNRRYEEVAHHTILLGPRYRELLRDIFDLKRLAPDFSLYLHRPTATDPTLAPKGCDAFYVLSPAPNLLGGQDWRVEAEPYRRRIATRSGGLDPARTDGRGSRRRS